MNTHKTAVFLIALSAALSAQTAPNRYMLILEDAPLGVRFETAERLRSTEAASYRQQVARRQLFLRTTLAARRVPITGSVDTLLNAIFVTAPAARLDELKAMPGVAGVLPLRRYHLNLNRATQLMNAPAAWNALGGAPNAGSGIKIAILDTGIDQAHPAFQDSSLRAPAGYPVCTGPDCAFTNGKVIVARSYVSQLAAGTSAANPAADSRPDDYSPRDRVGHGTAVASCAAGFTNTGTVTFSGMAPKAYLGNYKIYGSPGVNDGTSDDVIIMALEDALKDGMDIVSFSSGGPAFTGATDTGGSCGQNAGVPCDPVAMAFENAARQGLVIVAAAGNSGEDGSSYPTFNSIESPGGAPSVIAAGAITNSHAFSEALNVPGGGVPSNLQAISGQPGAFIPRGAVSAPLRDLAALGNDGLACTALPAGSLAGTIALIQRGGANCSFGNKMSNALAAGAGGVVFYMADSSAPIPPGGIGGFPIPGIMISLADGQSLKSFLASNPDHAVSINPAGLEVSATPNHLAAFSSIGPASGDQILKPDLVATGANVYMATQHYDPLGDVYGADGYAVADGTSFATPIISGAAALVKQKHPGFNGAQIKSALVNNAAQDVTMDETGNVVDIQSVGGGRLDAAAAVNGAVTAVPSTLSFGVLSPSSSLPITQAVHVTNTGTAAVTLTIGVSVAKASSGAKVVADATSLSLAAGASGAVNVLLSGSVPAAGSYSGAVTITGTGVSLRLPYLYLVGEGAAHNIIPLTGSNTDGTVGQGIADGIISFKLVDRYGVPVAGAPVLFTTRTSATLRNVDKVTDGFGIAIAEPVLGPQPGTYTFTASAAGLRTSFTAFARPQPLIPVNGVVNSASFDSNIAPGSYITIFGTGLSDSTDSASTAILPLSIDSMFVSFDTPAGVSVPGRLTYASPTQVNVQVPWELQGQSAAQVKATINFSAGNVVTVPLSDYAPAFFEGSPGLAAALDATYRVVNAGNPVRRGQVLSLFANGLGSVTNQPASGEPALASPLSETKAAPAVTIGGQPAQVLFSGLAPGFAALYQINVIVPPGIATGNQPLTLSIGNATAKASSITVQ